MNTPLAPVQISPVEDIVADMRAGRMVILVDEEDRENEGDLVLASDHVTPEAINFMAKFGRGLICLTLTRERSHAPPGNDPHTKSASHLRCPFPCINFLLIYQSHLLKHLFGTMVRKLLLSIGRTRSSNNNSAPQALILVLRD